MASSTRSFCMTWMGLGCWGTTTHTVYRVHKSTIIDIGFGAPGSSWLMSFGVPMSCS